VIGPGTIIRLSKNKDLFAAGKIQLRVTKDPKTSELVIPDEADFGDLALIKAAVYSGDLLVVDAEGAGRETSPYSWDGRTVLLQGSKKLITRLDSLAKEEGAVAKLEDLLNLEKQGKNNWGEPRKVVIKKIEELLSNIAGTTKVVDSDVEIVKVELVKEEQ